MSNKIFLQNRCDENEFLHAVRINGLLKYNMEKTGFKLKIPGVNILRVARDAHNQIIGGACGGTYLSSLEIEVLWVNAAFRGQNIVSQMLREMEAEAKKAGCVMAHLTTYSFQAPLFYEKNGYKICGVTDGFPDGIKLYMMKKQL